MPIAVIDHQELATLVQAAVSEAFARREAEQRKVFSLNQAARLARKRNQAVQAAVESGALPSHRHGRNWRILSTDLQAWIAAGCPA